MMRVVLANCRVTDPSERSATEHLGLASLAAVLAEGGFAVTVLDANYEPIGARTLLRQILAASPFLVGFTLYYNNADATWRTVEQLRHSGYRGHITLGGHHATFNALELLTTWPSVDSIVRGEGEGAMLDLARAISRAEPWQHLPNLASRHHGRPVANPCRPLIDELDRLPRPDRQSWGQVLRRTRTATLVSSRGCFGRCGFCSIRAFYRLAPGRCWRPLTPARIVDEAEDLVRLYGVERIRFMDDEFAGPGARGRQRARDIAAEIRRRRLGLRFTIVCRPDSLDEVLLKELQEAGLECIDVGIEAWTPRQLALYGKGLTVAQNEAAVTRLQRLGVPYRLYVMPIDPYVTPEELRQNLEQVARIGPEHFFGGSFLTRLVAFKGTAIEERLRQEGLLLPPRPKSFRGYHDYRLQDPRMRRLYPHIRRLGRGLQATQARLRRLFPEKSTRLETLAFGAEVARASAWIVLEGCLRLLERSERAAAARIAGQVLAQLQRAVALVVRAQRSGAFDRWEPLAVRLGRRRVVFPSRAVRQATARLLRRLPAASGPAADPANQVAPASARRCY